MLTSFTWQQFLLTAGAVSALYYLAVLLLFYRKDIKYWLKRRTSRAGLPADPLLPPQVSIMGPASPGPAPLLSEAASILVAPLPMEAEEKPQDTVVESILQEIKPLLDLATEADAEKEELLPLLRLVTARHSPSLEDCHRKSIEAFLLGQGRFSFSLIPEDLQSLWSEALPEQ